MSKELKWGETPWDNLTKEELLRTVQKYFSALHSAYFRLEQDSKSPNAIYWGRAGWGGMIFEKVAQCVEPLYQTYNQEQLQHAFFRYADDLLFERELGDMLGSGWGICNTCGRLVGENSALGPAFGNKCRDYFAGLKCPGTFRKLEWSDLKSEKEKDQTS